MSSLAYLHTQGCSTLLPEHIGGTTVVEEGYSLVQATHVPIAHRDAVCLEDLQHLLLLVSQLLDVVKLGAALNTCQLLDFLLLVPGKAVVLLQDQVGVEAEGAHQQGQLEEEHLAAGVQEFKGTRIFRSIMRN